MKILFIGNQIPEECVIDVKASSLAGNKFQSNFINCLRKIHDCDVLSFVAVSTTKEQREKISKFATSKNKYFYKEKNMIFSIFKYRKMLKKEIKKYDTVIAYNVAYPWLLLPQIARQQKTILILADFSDTNSYKNPLMKLYAKICKRDIRKYDYVIGLSKNAKKLLKKQQHFIYMPGGIDLDNYQKVSMSPIKNQTVKLMYSGNLSKVTGVDLLVEAIKKIKDNKIELVITGRGELENYINQEADGKKIKYLGSLPYKKYLQLLNESNILINPRNMNLPENQNNFPSKIFEYLAIGKVVISTKFVGYEDFKNNFHFCNSNVESLKKKIEEICENYEKIYQQDFVKNTKLAKEYDWNFQIKKIISNISNEV